MPDDVIMDGGPLDELRQFVADLLSKDHYFADIPVLLDNDAEIDARIRQSLAPLTGQGGASGICVVILFTSAKVTRPNIPGPLFDDLPLLVDTIEMPIVNRADGGTKKLAQAVALKAAEVLHQKWKDKLCDPLIVQEVALAPTPKIEDLEGAVIYQTRIKTGLKKQ